MRSTARSTATRLHGPSGTVCDTSAVGSPCRRTGPRSDHHRRHASEGRTCRTAARTRPRCRQPGSWAATAGSAWSAWARWVPGSSRSSPATGSTVVGVERDEAAVAARARSPARRSTDRAVAPRQADRGRAGRRCSAGSRFTHVAGRPRATSTWSSRRCPSSSSSSSEIFAELDEICPAGRDPGDQHLVAVGHRDLGRHAAARPGWSACTSSTRRRCMKLVEVVAHRGDRRPTWSPTSRRSCARLGKIAGRRRRPGRLHRQRPAVRLPQPRRVACSRRGTPPARTSTRR